MNKHRQTRRRFLCAAGAAASLPLALSMPVRRARAQTKQPKLIICTISNGLVSHDRDDWTCGGDENSLTLSERLADLEAVKNKVVAFSGLDNKAAPNTRDVPHDPLIAAALTGYAQPYAGGSDPKPSLDQFIASQRDELPHRFLGLSVLGHTKPLFRDFNNHPVSVEQNPLNVWRRIFADFMPEVDRAQLDALRAQRRSILDFLAGRSTRMKDAVGGRGRERLDAHLELIRKAERNLEQDETVAPACVTPGEPASLSSATPSNLPQIGEAQVDLAVAAAACDLSPVIGLSLIADYTQTAHHFDPVNAGVKHESAHDIRLGEDFRRINRFYIKFYTDLVSKLDAIPTTDGTVLDETIVVLMGEMRDGNHGVHDLPIVIAGGSKAGIRGGRMLRYNHGSINDLYTSLCHVMGAPVAKFGDPALCSGQLAGFL